MNNYETVFILTPDLSEAQMKEAVDKFADLITSEEGKIVNREEWGMRKLAYPIEKKSTGYYVLIEFESAPSFIETLEVNFRRDDRVIRFLTFRQDKYALEYAEKRRRNRKDAAEKAANEPEAANAVETSEEKGE